MTIHAAQRLSHDEINLTRLVRRLGKSVSVDPWDEGKDRHTTWIKVQGALQKVKYARRILRDLELDDLGSEPKSIQRRHDIHTKLDYVESFLQALEKRVAPNLNRPALILPTLPVPEMPSERRKHTTSEVSTTETEPLGQSPSLPTRDLLLSPFESAQPVSSLVSPHILIPPTLPPSSSKSTVTATPKFLQNSHTLQQDLSDQLAQMATQLKRNAIHFSESLAKDQAVVEGTQEKLEGNFDVMSKERLRLRDHRGKSGSTTCLVVMSVIVVAVSFVFMVSIIRFT